MINKDAFYREVSLALSENLDIRIAIHYCVKALKNYMPADGINIQLLEPSLKSSRSVISSFADYGEMNTLKDTIISMPEETRNLIKKIPLPDLRIINRPELDPIGEYFMETTGKNFSMLVMFLYKDKKRIGVVVLGATGRDRFTEDHLALFSLLREPFTLALNNYLQGQEIIKLQQMLDDDIDRKKHRTTVEDIVGYNFGLRNVTHLVQLVAPLDSPVLIFGETGVGKELISAAIHNASSRSSKPLVSVNCGAIPETLVDSELFGHEKGSFTGAMAQRKGRFERADQGTIFLDEIGELKPNVQVKLLRVLESGEIERVGGSEQVRVDVRIIAATHRNLGAMVSGGQFRDDLLFRINVFPILIPPLRARKKDIPALVDHFIQQKSKELSIYPVPLLGSKAIDGLMDYHWPGNVRELQNVVERELILYRRGPLGFSDFAKIAADKTPPINKPGEDALLPLNNAVAKYLYRVLKHTHGKISGPNGAAEILHVHPNTLRNKMNKLGIPYRKAQFSKTN